MVFAVLICVHILVPCFACANGYLRKWYSWVFCATEGIEELEWRQGQLVVAPAHPTGQYMWASVAAPQARSDDHLSQTVQHSLQC